MTQTLTRAPSTVGTLDPTPRRAYLVLAVVLLGQFMAVLDASIVNVAIPSIRTSLGANGSALQLIVSGYTIAYAVLLVTGARLGDRVGQRTMFLTGLVLFTVASLACGLAWNAAALVVFRVGQGVGAAAMVPQVMTLIQRTFGGAARSRALSAYAAVISGATVVGQIAGGLIVSADVAGTGWRGVFLVNVPIGLALLAVAPRLLPAATTRRDRRLDLVGLAVFTPAVLAFVVPLTLGHEQGWPAWTWLAFAGAVTGFAGFVLVERSVHGRGGEPLFADRVLRAPGLIRAAATIFVVMSTFSGWIFLMALHLQGTLGYSALHAGLLFLPNGALFAVAGMYWSRMPRRWHGAMIPAALLLAAAAMVALGVLLAGGRGMGVPELVVTAALGMGYGLAFSPLVNRALATVPPALAADASGILATSSQLGMAVGVAAFGSVYLSLAGSDALRACGIASMVVGATVAAGAALAARAAR
ncbi:MFS transporter [Nocardia sp. CDC159]|uniref:MFS transporter n=1 Tax=Nocardia pulmonis TaxID=2951408 RepID=A0A9X2J1I0_9NOCA|nr:MULTISPECIES: MFS transporter [Nocardia]MCM6778899.1 MFS transporter [Nocardia pulmonis]MCM6791788.1 MFS transporter [Nocardia sp. CDC159]